MAKKKVDRCSNEKNCGMGFDPVTKERKRLKPVFEREPVRPSDMLCSQCEGRLVEIEAEVDKK